MKRVSEKIKAVEEPAIEVIVRSENTELAVLAFFQDGNGGYDVLVGVSDPASRDNLKALFVECADSVGKAAFRPTRTTPVERTDNTPPF